MEIKENFTKDVAATKDHFTESIRMISESQHENLSTMVPVYCWDVLFIDIVSVPWPKVGHHG